MIRPYYSLEFESSVDLYARSLQVLNIWKQADDDIVSYLEKQGLQEGFGYTRRTHGLAIDMCKLKDVDDFRKTLNAIWDKADDQIEATGFVKITRRQIKGNKK
jgi:RNase adaptor protein for sRNA GlmZ degradation